MRLNAFYEVLMEWIKCSDRLPEKGKKVLMFSDIIWMGFINKRGHWVDWHDWNKPDYPVTHWQPLPEKPESVR